MTLEVRDIGKVKTVVQTLSVMAVLMAHAWPQWKMGNVALPGGAIAISTIWLMLAVSLISAFAYLRAFWTAATTQSKQRRKPLPFVINRSGDKNVRA
jgi:hypothetical protein